MQAIKKENLRKKSRRLKQAINGKIPQNLANDNKIIFVLKKQTDFVVDDKPGSFLSNPGTGMFVVSLRFQIFGFGLPGYSGQTTNILSSQAPFLG